MQARLADAQTAQAYAAALWQQRSLVAPSDTQLAALTHTLLLVVAVNVSVALLVRPRPGWCGLRRRRRSSACRLRTVPPATEPSAQNPLHSLGALLLPCPPGAPQPKAGAGRCGDGAGGGAAGGAAGHGAGPAAR